MQSIGLILFVGTGLEEDPRVGLFGWLNIAGYAVVGLVGIFFASRTGFPAALDPQISNRRRFLLPLAVGMGFGLLTILIEQFTHSIEFFLAETGMPRFNAQLPGSLLLYPGGAIILELIYRLLPVSLETWLISSVILRGRWQTQVFWVLAAASSTLEPSGQTGWVLERSLPMFLALYTSGFAFNLTQAYFFREYGFLAAISVRLGDYLVAYHLRQPYLQLLRTTWIPHGKMHAPEIAWGTGAEAGVLRGYRDGRGQALLDSG